MKIIYFILLILILIPIQSEAKEAEKVETNKTSLFAPRESNSQLESVNTVGTGVRGNNNCSSADVISTKNINSINFKAISNIKEEVELTIFKKDFSYFYQKKFNLNEPKEISLAELQEGEYEWKLDLKCNFNRSIDRGTIIKK